MSANHLLVFVLYGPVQPWAMLEKPHNTLSLRTGLANIFTLTLRHNMRSTTFIQACLKVFLLVTVARATRHFHDLDKKYIGALVTQETVVS